MSSAFFAQDCKDLTFRMLGGPELNFMAENAQSQSAGVRTGFTFGFDMNIPINCKAGVVTGINYNNYGFQAWQYSDSSHVIRSTAHLVEIPIGLRFYTLENYNLISYFFTLSYINAINVADTYSILTERNNYQVSDNEFKNVNDIYSPGLMGEIGIKNKFNQLNAISFSIYTKALYLNMFNENITNRYFNLAFGARLGYYF
jgi:hypothetical protein